MSSTTRIKTPPTTISSSMAPHLIATTSDDDDDDEFNQMLDNKLMNDYSDEDGDETDHHHHHQQDPLLNNNTNTSSPSTSSSLNNTTINNNTIIITNTSTDINNLKHISSSSNEISTIPIINNNSSVIVGGGSFVRNKENHLDNTSSINSNSKFQLIIEQLRIILLNNTYLYWIYYITMISLCLLLLVWSIIQQGRPHNSDKSIYELFLSIEGIITIILILEILVRIFVIYNGRIISYLFDDFINWFDLIVSIFCIIGFILYLVTVNKFEERIEELIDSLLISFRFVTQTFRIISLIRNHRKAKQQVQDQQFIDLSNSEPIQLMDINNINNNNNIKNSNHHHYGIINQDDDDDSDHHDTDDDENVEHQQA